MDGFGFQSRRIVVHLNYLLAFGAVFMPGRLGRYCDEFGATIDCDELSVGDEGSMDFWSNKHTLQIAITID